MGVYERDPHIQLREGDVLLTKDGTIGKVAIAHDLPGPSTLNSGVFVIRSLGDTFDPRFMYWVLSSQVLGQFIEYRSAGSTIRHLYQETFVDMPYPRPDLSIQAAIADFLDRGTGRIDALVEKKRRLIELLEEKRTALITEAVTNGLDATVPMKDSGIPWLGEVPQHWDCAPVYSRYEVFLGKMLSKEATAGFEQRPYLRNLNVRWGRFDLAGLATMSFDASERARYRLRYGDLLVCEGGEVGRAAIWQNELDECYFQKALLCVRPWSTAEVPRFLMYVLYAAAHMDVFKVEGNQATFVHLTGEKLRAHRFGFPEPAEQEAIVRHIEQRLANIDTAISTVGEQLALLAEYRQALITAAVTGQIDVESFHTDPEEAIA